MDIEIGTIGLRTYRKEDQKRVVSLADNRKISRWMTEQFPSPYREEDGEWWINHCLTQQPIVDYVITKDDLFIGGIGIELKSDLHKHSAEIGYWLGQEYWGEGVMSTVIPPFVEAMFEMYDLQRIYAGVFEVNIGSARVLEKSGFTFEGRQRNHIAKDGEIMDGLLYSILRDEALTDN